MSDTDGAVHRRLTGTFCIVVCALALVCAPAGASTSSPSTASASVATLGVRANIDPVPAAACWQRYYRDTPNDARFDVQPYSLAFNCPTSVFSFTFTSANRFPVSRGEAYVFVWIATGGRGCHGADHVASGALDSSGHFIAGVFSTPTCSSSTWALTGFASLSSPDFRTFALRFPAAGVGTSTFRWWGEIPPEVASGTADRFPNSGSFVASGVPYHPSASSGYWLTDAAGGVHAYGNARYEGDLGGRALAAPIVDMSALPGRDGYWLLGRDGGVFSYGAAAFYGSTGGLHLNRPVVGMTRTPSGHGYWFVASDGGIFSYGDAAFYGSTGALHLNRPIVGMAATPSGHGYWLVASDGGIFSFGDAAFYGSTGALHLKGPIVGMAATPSGHGYWLVASDGGIFSFGNAPFYGSTGALRLARPIVGMTVSRTGHGYRFVASDGGIFSFGDAPFWGSLVGTPSAPVVALDD